MAIQVIVRNDYKYEPEVWRADLQESFRLTAQQKSEYTVAAGYITKQTDSKWEFFDRVAPASTTPQTPPPYFFGDKSFRVDPVYSLQLTDQKSTTYATSGSRSLTVTTSTYNPATGRFDTVTTTVAGNAPRAITVESALTTLVQQPTAGTLIDGCIDAHFVSGKATIDLPWAETAEEIARATRRQMQRDSAMVRRIRCAANPLIAIGDTVRLTDQKRTVDASHIVTGKRITRDSQTGAADMQLTLEFWVR